MDMIISLLFALVTIPDPDAARKISSAEYIFGERGRFTLDIQNQRQGYLPARYAQSRECSSTFFFCLDARARNWISLSFVLPISCKDAALGYSWEQSNIQTYKIRAVTSKWRKGPPTEWYLAQRGENGIVVRYSLKQGIVGVYVAIVREQDIVSQVAKGRDPEKVDHFGGMRSSPYRLAACTFA